MYSLKSWVLIMFDIGNLRYVIFKVCNVGYNLLQSPEVLENTGTCCDLKKNLQVINMFFYSIHVFSETLQYITGALTYSIRIIVIAQLVPDK